MVYKESSVNEAERLGNEKETEHRFWTSSYTFDQFTVWEHDTHPSDEDMYVRLNQWLQLSNVLHE